MRPIFNKKNHIFLRWRLFFYTTLSLIIIIFDIQFSIFLKIQNYINYSSFFLHFFTDITSQWLQIISKSLNNNKELILENHNLKKELLIKNSELLLIGYYQRENVKLRELLSSPLLHNEKKILTQIISEKINPYLSHIVIDKGKKHGVYIGQPVIDDKGIIGQIIATNKFTSQVLLISDTSHALPVQILRNNIRMILIGNGYKKKLQLKYFQKNSDVKIGDMLITSGLGGRFPIGYPVGTVTSITQDNEMGCTIIQVSPTAKLENLSYLLLLWNVNEENKIPLSPDTVHKISKRRLNTYEK